MTKKSQQSSGPSYSLIALLKRTLFLHETAKTDELVEEVHECMLKDQTSDQVKTRYIEPLLRGNPSFIEVEKGSNLWKLSEGNKVNDAIYDMFRKSRSPLSERQVLNRLSKAEHFTKMTITIDLKNDARFSDLEGGKYWILSEWVVINEYARTILLKLKGGLTEQELIQKVVEDYHLNPETAVFIPSLDERFAQKDKKWTLKKFVEQKTKLRASLIDRLYKYLQKIGASLSADELTTSVLNMPANATDVEEKLIADPRFVQVDEKWDIQERVEKYEKVFIVHEAERVQQPPVTPEPETPPVEVEAEKLVELKDEKVRSLQQIIAEVAKQMKEQAAAEMSAPTEPLEAEVSQIEAEVVAPTAPEEVAAPAEQIPERVEPEEETAEKRLELLRNKVVDFLQVAFHSERIVYSADIIDQLVTAEERAELFEQFSLEHFANPAKIRELTDSDLIKFMIYLAEPTLNDKIVDPCCGTGGFLVQILKTLQANLQDVMWFEKELTLQYDLRLGQFYFVQLTPEERQSLGTPPEDARVKRLPIVRFCKQQQLTGVDSDQYAYKTADLNVALHHFPEIVLHHDNALTSKQIGSGVYDIVIGNPPAFEDFPTRFLRRSLLLAKPGGKILLLLPENMFSDSRLVSASLRNQMLAQTIIKAVIEFPEPYNTKAYGPRRFLLYCIKKHLEAEQQTSILVGRIPDFDGLRDVIEVLEDPSAPVSQSDNPIAFDLVTFILSSYQGSAYNLLLEGLRRQVFEGALMSVSEWMQMQKPDADQEEESETAPQE